MITYSQVSETKTHQFAAEASSLGFAPGHWPEHLETELGNRQPLLRISKKLSDEGELLHVRYTQAFGCIDLVIFND